MSWDESLFKFALKAWDSALRRTGPGRDPAEGGIALGELAERLHLIACASSGKAVEIREAEEAGEFTGSRLYLPARMERDAYLVRVLHSAAMDRLGLYLPTGLDADPLFQKIAAVLAAPAVARSVEEGFPGSAPLRRAAYARALERAAPLESVTEMSPAWRHCLRQLRGEELGAEWEWDGQEPGALWELAARLRAGLGQRPRVPGFVSLAIELWGLPSRRDACADAAGSRPGEMPADSLSSGTERKAKPREAANLVEMEEKPLEENPLVHVFEKVQTAEEYKAGRKAKDGSDEMEEQQDALDELDLREVIRSRERARSIYKADVLLDSGAPDLAGDPDDAPGIPYDEWDHSRGEYKRAWCSVRSSTPPAPSPVLGDEALKGILEANRAQVQKLRGKLARLLTERAWASRQPDGPEIDIDATVDHRACLLAGHSGNPRLYQSRRRREKDCATLILLDSSLSTDSWVADHRVLDVEKESMLVLAEVLDGLHDRVAVASFHSNTRQDCRFGLLKGFEEAWPACRQRVLALEPTGYTRIGPALRHATALLEKVPARRKLLLMISDGKPTDFDRYEGRYGIEDVKQAIREAAQVSVQVRALAIDTEAKFYLPRMFGNGNYRILPHPRGLAEAMARTFSEILG